MKINLDCELTIQTESTNPDGLSLKEIQGRLIALKRTFESLGCEVSISIRPDQAIQCPKCGSPMQIIGTVSEIVIYQDWEYYFWRCQCGFERYYDVVEYADF
jgi:hypothetical protein